MCESTKKPELPQKPDRLCGCGNTIDFQYSEILKKWYGDKCETCQQKEREQRELEEQRRLTAKRTEIFRKSIPALFHNARLDDLGLQLREKMAQKPFEQGLFLWGDTGIGKTHTMAALAYELIMKGARIKRHTFSQILYILKDGFKNTHSESSIMGPLQNTDVLIIEDIGVDKTGAAESDYSTKILNDLIDERLENRKPTLITSNLSPENIEKAYGPRISSRLATFMILRLTGEDRRKKNDNTLFNTNA